MRLFLRSLDNPAALLALVVTVLATLGIVMVYSASGARAGLENIRVAARSEGRAEEEYRFNHGANYAVKQITWATLALLLAVAAMKVPLDTLERYSGVILVVCLVVLVMVIATPLGVKAGGSKRWLRLGPFTIQPSEFAKIALVIFMAKFLATKRHQIRSFRHGFLPAVCVVGLFSALIVKEDLGTIVLMGGVVMAMWCLAHVRFAHLAAIGLAAIPALVLMVLQHSYRQNRILAFLDPEKYALTHAFQLNQSLIAVGSGGVFGLGLGNGLQKYHFLGESHTDFIFGIVCEELGLVGALSVCTLFTAFVFLGLRISYRAPDYFSGLLAAGLTMIVGLAAFINFFVVLGLAPTKGLALPFFSYGGSSMIASLVCAGLLVNIANTSLRAQGAREVF